MIHIVYAIFLMLIVNSVNEPIFKSIINLTASLLGIWGYISVVILKE